MRPDFIMGSNLVAVCLAFTLDLKIVQHRQKDGTRSASKLICLAAAAWCGSFCGFLWGVTSPRPIGVDAAAAVCGADDAALVMVLSWLCCDVSMSEAIMVF